MKDQLKQWLVNHSIQYEQLQENRFVIEEKTYLPLEIKEDVVIDTNFSLLLNEQEGELYDHVDRLIFYFGEKFYWTDKENVNNPDFNLLINMGRGSCDNYFNCFLGVHGKYELLNGSREYRDWCKKAKFLGFESLGICEKNTLAGVLDFQLRCKKEGLNHLIGETVTVKVGEDQLIDLKLFCREKRGWENLLLINMQINVVNRNRYVNLKYLLDKSKHLSCIILPECNIEKRLLESLKEIFQDNLYYQVSGVQYLNNSTDREYLNNLQSYILSDINPIIIDDAYYLEEQDCTVKSDLNSISGKRDRLSNNQYMKSSERSLSDIYELLGDGGERKILIALENTNSFSEKHNFSIEVDKFNFPSYIMSDSEKELFSDSEELFNHLVERGRKERLSSKTAAEMRIYKERIQRERDLFKLGNYIDYFLIIYDICRWCRENNIYTGFGRGSACGTLIGYLLYVTHIDPLPYGLLLERFTNEGRILVSQPDIDTDTESSRRDEVKRYIENKYGYSRVCSLGTYTTLQIKAALKDLSRVKGIPIQEVNYITKILDLPQDQKSEWSDLFKIATQKEPVKKFIQRYPEMIQNLQLLLHQPKAASVHACAMLILPQDMEIETTIPVRSTTVDGQELLVSEWEGEFIEKAGFLKEDILGISQLDKFRNITTLVKETMSEDIDIYSIPLDEREVYELFQQGKNSDVFHIGSRGLTAYSKEVLPESVHDLTAMLALYRPGPMENGFHTKYVKIKNREELPSYYYGCEEITKETYSLIIYQEQIMQICQSLGGFSLTEADDVRKAIGKKKGEILDSYRDRFIQGAVSRSCPEDEAIELWETMERFASYCFNKCISGRERFYRPSSNNSGKSTFRPTIEQMWLIKNDREYAKKIGKLPLHSRYNYEGYGTTFSLNGEKRLIKNRIKDITFQGQREVYKILLENGRSIVCTDNHKFPTSNGEKELRHIDIEKDKLFFNRGYRVEDTMYRFTDKGKLNNTYYHSNESIYKYELNSEKGKEGFQKRVTPRSTLIQYQREEKKECCEICDKSGGRLEVHHKDGDHSNNVIENLITVCVSCHKKEHYKMGRVKVGEKGLLTDLVQIESIKSIGIENVYDVEMEAPHHTFITDKGIVTCNSHAAAYSVTAYICQYLKWKYPIQFWTTAFQFASSENTLRFVAELSSDKKIKLLPPDINASGVEFTSDFNTNEIFWSITKIKQCGPIAVTSIFETRDRYGDFFSLQDFLDRIDRRVVNKSVVENLILSGAFDKLEELQSIIDRKILIRRYRELCDIKINTKTDDILRNVNIDQEWWWLLQQKRLCGLAIFDWKKIVQYNTEFDIKKFMLFDEIELDGSVDKRCVTGGIITEIDVRESKKGTWMKILVEQNYNFLWIYLWSELYERFSSRIIGQEGNILICNGRIDKNNYGVSENILQSEDSFEIKILG